MLTSWPVSAAFGVSGLLVAGGWARTYYVLRGATQPIITHWTSGSGITEIARPEEIPLALARLGATGLLIVLVNFFLAIELERRTAYLGKLLAVGTFFIAALIYISFSAIIAVN